MYIDYRQLDKNKTKINNQWLKRQELKPKSFLYVTLR